MRYLSLAIAGAALAIALPAAAQDTAITSTPKGSAPAATLAQGAKQQGTAGQNNTAAQQKSGRTWSRPASRTCGSCPSPSWSARTTSKAVRS